MVVQSDKQLRYLVTNKGTNSLRVLLFDDDLAGALQAVDDLMPVMDKAPLDYILLNVTSTSKDLTWLKLPSTDTTLVTDSTVVPIQLLPSLRALACSSCLQLTSIQIRELKQLQFLDLHGCKSIITLAVNGLVELQYMNLDSCASFFFKSLDSLIYLELRDCSQLIELSGLDEMVTLQHLDVSNSSTLTTVDVTGLTSLQHLDLSRCGELTRLTDVDTLTALQHLDLSLCWELCSSTNFLDLTGLSHLQMLDLRSCARLLHIYGINTLVSLHTLILEGCPHFLPLDLTELTSLRSLQLSHCKERPAVIGISKLTLLTTVTLVFCHSLSFCDEGVGFTMAAMRSLKVSNDSILAYFSKQKLPALNELMVLLSKCIVTIDLVQR